MKLSMHSGFKVMAQIQSRGVNVYLNMYNKNRKGQFNGESMCAPFFSSVGDVVSIFSSLPSSAEREAQKENEISKIRAT